MPRYGYRPSRADQALGGIAGAVEGFTGAALPFAQMGLGELLRGKQRREALSDEERRYARTRGDQLADMLTARQQREADLAAQTGVSAYGEIAPEVRRQRAVGEAQRIVPLPPVMSNAPLPGVVGPPEAPYPVRAGDPERQAAALPFVVPGAPVESLKQFVKTEPLPKPVPYGQSKEYLDEALKAKRRGDWLRRSQPRGAQPKHTYMDAYKLAMDEAMRPMGEGGAVWRAHIDAAFPEIERLQLATNPNAYAARMQQANASFGKQYPGLAAGMQRDLPTADWLHNRAVFFLGEEAVRGGTTAAAGPPAGGGSFEAGGSPGFIWENAPETPDKSQRRIQTARQLYKQTVGGTQELDAQPAGVQDMWLGIAEDSLRRVGR